MYNEENIGRSSARTRDTIAEATVMQRYLTPTLRPWQATKYIAGDGVPRDVLNLETFGDCYLGKNEE